MDGANHVKLNKIYHLFDSAIYRQTMRNGRFEALMLEAFSAL